MLKAADVDKIAAEVKSVPEPFCQLWPAFRAAANAIVKQISNPLVGVIWGILRGVLNGVYKKCPA